MTDGVTQQFAIRYLNMFNKAAPLTTFTRLCLHNEQPLVVEYRIENLGVLKYYLAPKISDEWYEWLKINIILKNNFLIIN